MIGWLAEIEAATEDNKNFRTVVYAGEHTQLTLMCLTAGSCWGELLRGQSMSSVPAL